MENEGTSSVREAECDQKAALKVAGPAWVLPAPKKWTISLFSHLEHTRNIRDGEMVPVTSALDTEPGSG